MASCLSPVQWWMLWVLLQLQKEAERVRVFLKIIKDEAFMLFAVAVQSLSRVWLCDPIDCSMPGFLVRCLLEFHKFTPIELVMLSKHLTFCQPLLLSLLIFPNIRIFSNKSALHVRWPKYRSFSSSINPSNDYSGLASFRVDWFYLLAVQGTLKSLLQKHNWKALILQCSAFFMVQLSHLYMTTEETITLAML